MLIFAEDFYCRPSSLVSPPPFSRVFSSPAFVFLAQRRPMANVAPHRAERSARVRMPPPRRARGVSPSRVATTARRPWEGRYGYGQSSGESYSRNYLQLPGHDEVLSAEVTSEVTSSTAGVDGWASPDATVDGWDHQTRPSTAGITRHDACIWVSRRHSEVSRRDARSRRRRLGSPDAVDGWDHETRRVHIRVSRRHSEVSRRDLRARLRRLGSGRDART